MDELIQKYAGSLQTIYDNRTAGDHTFTGVLVHFLMDVDRIRSEEDAAWDEHERRKAL